MRGRERTNMVVNSNAISVPDMNTRQRVLRTAPTIFSFFAGAGFLDLGFETQGYKIGYVNEVHAPFLDAYEYARKQLKLAQPMYGVNEGSAVHFTSTQGKGQLSELIKDARRTSDIIGFIGGPPCPDFSVGGKNKGREGDNGKLSSTYIELICQQKPDFYLFENVKGLWRTKKHRAFYEELKSKTQEEYVVTERLTNAIEYGAPQDRARIILIGFRKDLMEDIGIKDQPQDFFPWKKYAKYPAEMAFSYPWPETNPFQEDSVIPCSNNIAQELTVEYWFQKNEVVSHPNADHYFQPKAGLSRMLSVAEGDDSKKSFKRLHRWRYSPTACYGNNEVHLHPYKARRISVAESMAIQSLPKDFSFPASMTLTDSFKAIGNGVPYVMASALAKTILDFLGGSID